MDDSADDAVLVRACLAGAGDAYDVLVRRYQRQAFAVAYRLLNSREDALDVAQDASLRAYRSLGQLEDPSRFGAWLMRVVSNLALNRRRSRKANPASGGLDEFVDMLADVRTPGGGTAASGGDDGGLEAGELRRALSAAIEELPEHQRSALVLFAVEQMPQREVADVLGCTVELVKWNVFQARKTLRKQLAKYLGGEK